MNENDIAFAAGFYEGEGYCRNKRTETLVQITQKNCEILYRLKDLFGGEVHCWGNQGVFQLVMYTKQSVPFLRLIYPYLSKRRKEQVDRLDIMEKAA